MSAEIAGNWREDFGIDSGRCSNFFSGKDDLTSSNPQAHVLRHAFDLLELNGVLCSENTPLIYFKLVDAIRTKDMQKLHREFWNHGGAPILVVVSKDQVHVYSGMSRPVSHDWSKDELPSLVSKLNRVKEGLREFIVSVESGEFFRRHARSFDPDHRVDRELLGNLREARDLLSQSSKGNIAPKVLDALLCRLVFTCYLFDRDVILPKYLQDLGIENAKHLRDILDIQPVGEAKITLYKLFQSLGEDFNGDLFSDDLLVESRKITNRHIQILNDLFHGTNLRTGQHAFWPYDFGFIPIETISAIYEHFLKEEDQKDGAFYTPRFLAEIVLDSALEPFDTLLGKKFLDPACGSGIFLVGLFNRIAEEWKQANPRARYDRRAKELMRLLQESLFGVDKNSTACRITAFSLYLAYLDQLAPSDIQQLQEKGGALPRLIVDHASDESAILQPGNVHCSDFFQLDANLLNDADLVLGNPPWGSIATDETDASKWCAKNHKQLPDNQIAVAFVWKGAEHASEIGRVCFLLPHGTLINHGPRAIEFQRAWVREHAIQRVLNLADIRQFLFSEATHPAIVVEYRKSEADTSTGHIDYWTPKADWMITQAEVIKISPIDRRQVSVADLLSDLDGPDAPQVWTQNFWASRRDLRLIDKLSLSPRLRDHVRLSSEKGSGKPWVRAEGFQPPGANDDPNKTKTITLPSTKFVEARSDAIDLFMLPTDCDELESRTIAVRGRSNTNTEIYKAPHVLITKGFKRIAFADFDVSFRHAVRGIHGPNEDRNLLMFLAAFLRSPIAQYFAFHTSANRSMFHEEVHVNELLRLPFPFPDQQADKVRSRAIVDEVAHIVERASTFSHESFLSRSNEIENATEQIAPLIDEYFDVQPSEKLLIEDTIHVLIPSIQPSQRRMPVPTVKASSPSQQNTYVSSVCESLNKWTKNGEYVVRGSVSSSTNLGIGIARFEKISRSRAKRHSEDMDGELLQTFDRLRSAIPSSKRTLDPTRELMIFDENRLYLVKPIGLRHWTRTAALNDADEIAGTILMHSSKENA